MKTFGERVKEARLQRGLSQQDLADAIGMKSRSTINKIELGTRNTKIETAKKIARALNVDPDYLVFGDSNEQKDEIIQRFSQLDETQQQAVLAFLRTLTEGREADH